MSNLFRFNIMRPAQELPEEKQDTVGTRTHADETVSAWAADIFGLCELNDHEALYESVGIFLQSADAVESYSGDISSFLEDVVAVLRRKGRKITARAFMGSYLPAQLTAYFAGPPVTASDYDTDKQKVEDTILALAIFGKLGNKGNINHQLIFKATQLLKATHDNGGILTDAMLNAILQRPTIIPYCRYNPCTKKYDTETRFPYLDLLHSVRPPRQKEEGDSEPQLPDNPPAKEGDEGPSRGEGDHTNCDCKCDETCVEQNSCCAELKPFVTDLMIVREELVCYQPKHLAYIENVLMGETRERVHRNLERTETFSETETETTKTTEKDHQVEDRFSLKSEVEKTITQDLSIEAGVTVSGEFGTTKYSTNFNLAYDLSKQESSQISQDYARNVVTRSLTKVEERVRELNSTKKTTETEETNTHTLDNKGGTKHIVGQYHFVNMINRAQVMNYGKRLMFEFVLPEPMELYKTLIKKVVAPFGETKPNKPLLRSDQIHPKNMVDFPTTPPDPPIPSVPTTPYDELVNNPIGLYYYNELVTFYGISGVDPMPDADIFIPFSFAKTGVVQGENALDAFTVDLCTVPNGYKAIQAEIEFKADDYVGDFQTVSPSVPPFTGVDPEFYWFVDGQNSGLVTGGINQQVVSLEVNEGSQISMAMTTKSCIGIAGSGWIKCVITAQAKATWQARIWEKIMAKYQQNLEEYKTALARYEQDAITKYLSFGTNPFINRETERAELKRAAISYISCQFYDQFTSMKRSTKDCGYPEMDLEQAQRDGAFVQFFEQLFDWNLMTYLFYPYFWGQKCTWAEKIQIRSNDPLFDKALAAGSARVQVPVRLGHEPLALHWVAYGEIWQGQSEPPVPGSSYYVSMAQEIKEQKNCFYTDRPGELAATPGQDWVTLSATDTYWDAATDTLNTLAIDADIDREIMINCEVYRVVDIIEGERMLTNPADPNSPYEDPTYDPDTQTWHYTTAADHSAWTIHLERAFEGKGCCGCDTPPTDTIEHIKYSMGALFVGAPFEVVVPTNLVFLRNQIDPATGAYISADCLPCYPLDSCQG